MTAPPDDRLPNEETFSLLDSYLEDLHAGRHPDRTRFLAEHPELAEALDCLEALDRLAPMSVEVADPKAPPPADADELPTITLPPGAETAPEEAAHETPSVQFGKYELLDEVGRGGMAVVYRARQRDLGRPVALKMILAGQWATPDLLSRFEDEARAAAGLSHPHIVTVYEAGQVQGQPYIAMRYVAGPTLARLLQRGPLPPEEAARCLCPVARAVAHLHEHGIVHRDLKPSNILLDEHGQPYVSDFGLAKMLTADSHRTSTGAVLGTPSYMSPEQAAGGRGVAVGPLSDVYSLGAVLYEALTGQPPFRGETALDTLVQVMESEPVRPCQINPATPRELEMICLRCLEKASEDRYPCATAVADDLERFLKGEEVETKNPGPAQQLRRWARREPALVSRLGALAVVCTIAQVNYQLTHSATFEKHLTIMASLGLWGLASLVSQRLLYLERWADLARYGWAAADLGLLTVIWVLGAELVSPIIVGYPVLIAASGLWFRVRLVWFTTALAFLCYGGRLLEYRWHEGPTAGLHRQLMFLVALIVMGFVIAYQVNRVRALSRYYESRPLP